MNQSIKSIGNCSSRICLYHNIQGISDMEPNVFFLGGNNVTGLRIVDHMNLTVRTFVNDGWGQMRGHRRISVSIGLEMRFPRQSRECMRV